MSKKSKTPPWVRFDGAQVWCLRCGAKEAVIPVGGISLSKKRLQIMTLIGAAFDEEHAICKETPASPINKKANTPQEWAESHDVGLSSATICYVMSGVTPKRFNWRDFDSMHGSAPADPSDFGRCYRLLQCFPAWRFDLSKVVDRFPGSDWVELVAAWDSLTKFYESELPTGQCPLLFAEMSRLANLSQKRRKNGG